MSVNKHYKDSVFSFLFSDPATLRELYEALEGITLPPDVPITINTLTDVLFLDRINDISFEIANKLIVLLEHQSTINPNMAVRLLMYIARIYEKILGEANIYSGRRQTLPRPEFIVLYNGTAPYPDMQTLKLSDSFAEASALGLPAEMPPDLELTVKVYNINAGRNEAVLQRSKTLVGYSAFVAKVRECESEIAGTVQRRLNKDEQKTAMTAAIKWCIKNNVLKKFLETNSSEVINMLLTEWDWDKYVEVQRYEAAEDGRAEGIAKGIATGRSEGIATGRSKGWAELAALLQTGKSIDEAMGILQSGNAAI